MAREDEDGFWYIVDRTKDMIVTGGFNVFPREVEDVVATHPAVAQVAVIGTPHEKFGEAVTALVVPRDGVELDRRGRGARSSSWCATPRAASRRPSRCWPSTPSRSPVSGKPDKKALRAQFWEDGRSVG